MGVTAGTREEVCGRQEPSGSHLWWADIAGVTEAATSRQHRCPKPKLDAQMTVATPTPPRGDSALGQDGHPSRASQEHLVLSQASHSIAFIMSALSTPCLRCSPSKGGPCLGTPGSQASGGGTWHGFPRIKAWRVRTQVQAASDLMSRAGTKA